MGARQGCYICKKKDLALGWSDLAGPVDRLVSGYGWMGLCDLGWVGLCNDNNRAFSIQRKRKNADKFSAWTELVGVRLPKPDDPILLQFKKADDESRPLRLVMSVRP